MKRIDKTYDTWTPAPEPIPATAKRKGECGCEDVNYHHRLDGGCCHKACEGDMSELGCGEIVSGTPTDTCVDDVPDPTPAER